MTILRRRIGVASCIALLAVGATGFSFFGAYQTQRARALAATQATAVATALQATLTSAAAASPEVLRAALQAAAEGASVDAVALAPAGESTPLVFPAKEGTRGEMCRNCHRGTSAPPAVWPQARGQGDFVLVHRRLPAAGGHLAVRVEVSELLHAARADLGVAGAVAASTGLLLLGLLWWGSGTLLPGSRGAAGADAAGADSAAEDVDRTGSATRLGHCLDCWNDAVSTVLGHLGELKLGAQRDRETGREVVRAAEQFDAAMGGVRSHLNGIATSTSDNSTSLIQMSASIDEVASSADQLAQYVSSSAAAVLEMVQSIGDVADRVTVLAKETDVTASSLAQIDASTREIEVNAREAAGLGGRMADAATEGSRAVQETLEGIHSSYDVIRETARAIDELKQASGAIGGVVKIINEINDKTKLLSLNAAIIAAQAGEHGKSFAVVAHEIKNLSDRTAASTKEISRLVRGILERVEVATEAVGRGKGATGRSVDLAEKAGEALRHILDTVQVSRDMTRTILRATEEQSRGSKKVMRSMEEVGALVTYIRHAAVEHRSSGESVSASTEVMRDLTEQVKLATAEQADVSRYISEAIAAIDRNLQGVVEAADSKQHDTEQLSELAHRLAEQGETGALEIQAIEEYLGRVDQQMQAVAEAAWDFAATQGETEA